MFSSLKYYLSSFINKARLIKAVFYYRHQSLKYMKKLGIPNIKVPGENEYIKKWSVLSRKVDRSSYRLYSRYCGGIPEIVPEGIGRIIIEEKLNPPRYRDFYNDKTQYPVLLGEQIVPSTFICRINGSVLLNSSFLPLSTEIITACRGFERLILKPSIDSSSGKGVELFTLKDGEYVNGNGIILTEDYLLNYSMNFVLQEAIEQHQTLAVFNYTSLNSIRIATYRSIKDETPHVLSAILRIGKTGSTVDNAHAGGRYIGINVSNGKLGSYTCDQYGNKSAKWNDIDFSVSTYFIPEWENVLSFAEEVTRKIHHHRLLALDITVSKNGQPKLIEYNIVGFSYWLFEFTNQKPLGDYTDEIICYCK